MVIKRLRFFAWFCEFCEDLFLIKKKKNSLDFGLFSNRATICIIYRPFIMVSKYNHSVIDFETKRLYNRVFFLFLEEI